MNTTLTEIKIQSCKHELTELDRLFSISSGKQDPAAVQQIIQLEKMRGTQYLVAEIDQDVVGFVGYWIPQEERDIEPPQIIDLAVLPAYQGQGIGQALLNAAVHTLQKHGCQTVMILVNSSRVEDLAFFKKCGFIMVSLIADWHGSGVSKAIFRQNI